MPQRRSASGRRRDPELASTLETTRKEFDMSTIVVGVDGSDGSLDALQYAIDEARSHGADVEAVSAWHVPTMIYTGGYIPMPPDPTGFERATKAALDKALSEVAAETDGVEITPVVREGQAAEVLVEAAKSADLLVVGSRGRGGFTGLLLGSVSQQCAQHAPCPVVVVPHHE
jgi:nucleotide-binding universal stress UspA family protein